MHFAHSHKHHKSACGTQVLSSRASFLNGWPSLSNSVKSLMGFLLFVFVTRQKNNE